MPNRRSSLSRQLRLAPLALATAAALASVCGVGEASPVMQPAVSLSDIYQAWADKHPVAALAGDYLKALPPITNGTTITVGNCNDAGSGSLRAAIASANSGDTIDLTARNCTISLTSGEIAFTLDDLTISGPGADLLTIDGGYSSKHYNRIFNHGGAGTLSISGVSLTDAKYTTLHSNFAKGGCILSSGEVSVVNSTISHCFTQAANNFIASGAGINAAGGVILRDSIVTGNLADAGSVAVGAGWGAGIYCHGNFTAKYSTISDNNTFLGSDSNSGGVRVSYGNVYILGTTIANNSADVYGGIYISGGGGSHTAKIYNSTISSNAVTFGTGGLGSAVTTTIANSTIAFNTSVSTGNGAGVRIFGSDVDLQSSIIAENTSSNGLSDLDVAAATGVTGASNLITQSVGTVPAGTLTSCPLLGRLTDNGGSTLTHALLTNSPAIDAGNNNTHGFLYDQRGTGHPRKSGAATDIGAFEYSGVLADDVFRSEFETRCN